LRKNFEGIIDRLLVYMERETCEFHGHQAVRNNKYIMKGNSGLTVIYLAQLVIRRMVSIPLKLMGGVFK